MTRGVFQKKPSPPKFSASGRGRCRAACRLAHRGRASLSDAAGDHGGDLPPGSGSDILARILGPRLSELLGQQVIIASVGAGGGITGAYRVARAAPPP